MIDTGEVDDKIVAVLKDDSVCVTCQCPCLRCAANVTHVSSYGHITTISELPAGVVDRLRHYFLTCASPLTLSLRS
jgi:inorganic pyrophosphatase